MLEKSKLNASLKLIEHIQKTFNEEGAGKHVEDPVDVISDPTMIAHVELGRTIHHRAPVTSVAEDIKNPKLADLIQRFLYHQLLSDSRLDSNASSSEASSLSRRLPTFNGKMFLHSSASSIFFAPSDPSGIHGFRREQIRSSWSWWGGSPRQDVVLVNTGDGGNNELPMSGYSTARVLLFFFLQVLWQTFSRGTCMVVYSLR